MQIPRYLTIPAGTPLPANAYLCDMCHKPAFELRPFGPHGESVCEPCSHYAPGMAEAYHIPIPGPATPDAEYTHSHAAHTHSHGDD